MTSEEYKQARTALGMNVNEWIEKLGISRDAHKSYNSGRAPVQLPVKNHIETLLELDRLKGVLSTLK